MGIEKHSVISDEQIFEILATSAYIMVNKRLLERFGPEPTVLLANLIDKYKYFKENEQLEQGCYFYLVHDEQMQQTGMSLHKIKACKKMLKDADLLSTKRMANKEYYKLEASNIIRYVESGSQMDINEQPVESQPPASGNTTANTKENKTEEKKLDKKKFSNFDFPEFLKMFPEEWQEDEDFQKALESFVGHRRELNRPLTKQARVLSRNELTQVSVEIAAHSLEEAVRKGYIAPFVESGEKSYRRKNGSAQRTPIRDQTPEQIIRTQVNGSYAGTFYGYFEFAQQMMPNLSDAEYLDLAQNMVTLRRYMLRKQTDTAKEHNEVPTPGSLVHYYTEWLVSQTWINDMNPSLYTADHTIFATFIHYISSNLGVHVLTGSTKTYSLTE